VSELIDEAIFFIAGVSERLFGAIVLNKQLDDTHRGRVRSTSLGKPLSMFLYWPTKTL